LNRLPTGLHFSAGDRTTERTSHSRAPPATRDRAQLQLSQLPSSAGTRPPARVLQPLIVQFVIQRRFHYYSTVWLSSSNHLTLANIISYHIISTLYRDPETPSRKDRKEQRRYQKTSAPLSETGTRLLSQSRPAGSPQGSDQRPYSSNSQYISLSSTQEAA
jgi:hypothetical protein